MSLGFSVCGLLVAVLGRSPVVFAAPPSAIPPGPPASSGGVNPCNAKSGGVFPELAYHQGRLWCAVQTESALRVVELEADLSVRSQRSLPLGPGSLAFPRMASEGSGLWLAYRDADTARLVNLTTGLAQDLGVSGGNDPVAVGGGLVAWQSADRDFTINTRPLSGGAPARQGPGRPTGLSRVLPGGRVTLIDDDRFEVPPGTRPCWAGDMAVVEGPESGNIARLGDGRQALLFPGKEAFTPKCAAQGGRYAVASWGREGVFIAQLGPGDFSRSAAAAAGIGRTSPPATLGAPGSTVGAAATGASSGAPSGEGGMRLAFADGRAAVSGGGSGSAGGYRPPDTRDARNLGSSWGVPQGYCEDAYKPYMERLDDVAAFATCRGAVWRMRNANRAMSCAADFAYHGIPAWQWRKWVDNENARILEACNDVAEPGPGVEAKYPPSVKERLLAVMREDWKECKPSKGISCICNPNEPVCKQFMPFFGRANPTPPNLLGPSLGWLQPADNATLPATAHLEGTASDASGVARVDILVNLKKVGEAQLSGSRWSYELDTSGLPAGGFNLSALAVNSRGESSRDTIRAYAAAGGEQAGGGESGGGAGGPTCEPPNEKALIEEVAARPGMAEALRRACRNGTDWTFPDTVVDELRRKDSRWGYLCRRGNCGDPSHDVIAYYCGQGRPAEGASSIRAVDYIVASCYNPGDAVAPRIGWGVLDPPAPGERGWTSRGRF